MKPTEKVFASLNTQTDRISSSTPVLSLSTLSVHSIEPVEAVAQSDTSI